MPPSDARDWRPATSPTRRSAALATGILLALAAPAFAQFTSITHSIVPLRSSASAWGDYDGDGDLDLALMGSDSPGGGTPLARIYRNDSGNFSDIGASVASVDNGALSWADYDGDGDLDLLVTGLSDASQALTRLYRNDGGTFVDSGVSFPDVWRSSIAWADFDNDGDTDVVIAGDQAISHSPLTRLYRRTGAGYVDTGAPLVDVSGGSVAFGDYDNDGDPDLLLTGRDVSETRRMILYRNDSGVLVDSGMPFTGVDNSATAWMDADNDGDLDFALCGRSPNAVSRVYFNQAGSSFSFTDLPSPALSPASVCWGDFDADGFADLLLTGNDDAMQPQTILYRSVNGNSYALQPANLEHVLTGDARWGDYDNDNKLDILLTGFTGTTPVTRLYRNTGTNANTPPSPPGGLVAESDGSTVTFTWLAGSDTETNAAALSYNLIIGTTSGGNDVVPSESSPATGYRRVVRLGNRGLRSGWSVPVTALPSQGYWSVQSVDASLAGSTFATEQSFSSAGLTSTVLISSPNPSVIGTSVLLTATVAPVFATGSVTFKDGGAVLGTTTLSAGVAELTTTSLEIGSHSLTAEYSGGGGYTASTSPPVTHLVVPLPGSSTVLVSDPNPSDLNQAIMLTATVTPATATGSITFKDGASSIGGPVTLVGGVAYRSTNSLSAGSHDLSAVYSGDSGTLGSTSPVVTHTVRHPTVTTLSPSPSPSILGEAVTLTATVTPGTATGLVSFTDGAATIGSSTLTGGVATFVTTGLAPGWHQLRASYAGSPTHTGSQSGPVGHTVLEPSSTALVASPSPSVVGDLVVLTATLTPPSASGTVTFLDDGAALGGPVNVSGGAAARIVTMLTPGVHGFSAVYSGSPTILPSTSPTVEHLVRNATTTVTTSSPNPSSSGQGVTISATVSPPSATGEVSFRDGVVVLGTGLLAGGVASMVTTTLSAGVHGLSAVYAGDVLHVGSSSLIVPHTVLMPTTTALASSPNPSLVDQPVTLSVSVSPATATGTLTVKEGAEILATISVSGGAVELQHTFSVPGLHGLTAEYSGDGGHSGSVSTPVSHLVQSPTILSLAASPNPSIPGQLVTLTASATPPAATGTITFLDGAATLGTAALPGPGTLAISNLGVGGHPLTAVYSGDGIHLPATSNVVSQFVEGFTNLAAPFANVSDSDLSGCDYDSDGDLDLVVTGQSATGPVTKIYRNVAGTFVESGIALPGVRSGAATWGDYDNDGDPDLLLCGLASTGPYAGLFNNGGGSFTEIAAALPGVEQSSSAWGDFDSDGDLDIVLSGFTGSSSISRVYRNSGGQFSDIGAGLPGIRAGRVSLIDLERDGDLDIFLAGESETGPLTRIYRNTGNLFVDAGAGLTGVQQSAAAWGDFDSDGDPDLALAGTAASGALTRLYRNDSGLLTPVAAGLPDLASPALAWGDADNDGDPDLFAAGIDTTAQAECRIFQNEAGLFSDTGLGFVGVGSGSGAWGDLDGDGDLDLVISGHSGAAPVTRMYRNNVLALNTPPTPPEALTGQVVNGVAALSWSAASDGQTPAAALTYNIRIGSTPGGSEFLSAMSATESGFRRLAAPGNVGTRLSWSGPLPRAPIYYWSVQAIDASFRGSAFAGEQVPCHAMSSFPNSQSRLLGQTSTLSTTPGSNGPYTFQWFKNGVAVQDGSRTTGATTGTLTITNLQFSDAADYAVSVSNQCQTELSPVAALGVLQSNCGAPLSEVWVQRNPAGPLPEARIAASVCYDLSRRRVLMMGGISTTGYLTDFWSWDGSQWQPVTRDGLLTRGGASIAYDSARDRVVLFGGRDNVGYLADTWEFDGSTWRQVATDGPPGQLLARMAYDEARGRIVLINGLNSFPPQIPAGDTWEWDGSTWSLREASSPNPPSALFDFSNMTYDPVLGRVVRISQSGNIWGWTGWTWNLEGVGLAGNTDACMAFDAARGQLVVQRSNGLWEWDGTTAFVPGWTGGPNANRHASLVYDPARQRIVQFGGGWMNSLSNATFELVVSEAPAISRQPANTVLVDGLPARLDVGVRGNGPLTYRWMRNGIPLSDGAEYTGTRTDTLTCLIPSTAPGGQYSVQVSNTCGTATSAPASVLNCGAGVTPPDPAPVPADSGGVVSLTVAGTGTPPVAYEWRREGAALIDGPGISGSQTATLTLSALAAGASGRYDCRLTYACGVAIIPARRVDVCSPLSILRQPVPTGARSGQDVAFSVRTQGGDTGVTGNDGPAYQWRLQGVPLTDGSRHSGANAARLLITSTAVGDTGNYDVVVTTRCGSQTSASAALQLLDVQCGTDIWTSVSMPGFLPRYYAAGCLDTDRGTVVVHGGLHFSNYSYLGDTWEYDGAAWTLKSSTGPAPRKNAAMCHDPARGRTVLFGGTSANGVSNYGDTWEWDGTSWELRSTSGPVARAKCSLAFDAALGVIRLFGGEGNGTGRLTDVWQWDGTSWTPVTPVNSGPPGRPSAAMIYDPGREGLVVAGGGDPLYWWTDTWLLKGDQWSRLSTTTPKVSFPSLAYDLQRRCLVMTGRVRGSAVWEFTSGAWRTRTSTPSTTLPDLLVYSPAEQRITGIALSGWGSAIRTVLDPPTPGGATAVSAPENGEARLEARGEQGTSPFQYQWRRNGIDLVDGGRVTGSRSSTLILNPATGGDSGPYECLVINACGAAAQAVQLTVCGTPQITQNPQDLSLTGGDSGSLTAAISSTVPAKYQWFHDDYPVPEGNGYSGTRSLTLTISGASGYHRGTYTLRITNCQDTWSQPAQVFVTCPNPLSITTEPQDLTVAIGQSATFTAGATGCGPLAYAWFKEGVAIPGPAGTGPTLTIPSVTPADSGAYYLRVADYVGHTFTRTATLNRTSHFWEQDAGQVNPGNNFVFVAWRTARPAVVDFEWGPGFSNRVTGSAPATSGLIGATFSGLPINHLYTYRLVATEPSGARHVGRPQSITKYSFQYFAAPPITVTAVAATEAVDMSPLGEGAAITLRARNTGPPAGPVSLLSLSWGGSTVPRDAAGFAIELPAVIADSIDTGITATMSPDLRFPIHEVGAAGGQALLDGTTLWYRYVNGFPILNRGRFTWRLPVPASGGTP